MISCSDLIDEWVVLHGHAPKSSKMAQAKKTKKPAIAGFFVFC